MWIKKIEFQNFKPYREAVLKFPPREEKNISIIEGKNDTGKTSFLEAIKWCLYGSREFNIDTYQLINKPRDANKELMVAMLFTDRENSYQVRRSASPKKGREKASEEIELIRNGSLIRTEKSKAEKEDYIKQKILPRNINKFFFFKGEDTENIAKNLGEKEILDNIALFLGFKSIEHAVEDLENKVIESWDEALKNKRSQCEDIDSLQEEKEKLENKKDQLDEEVEMKNNEKNKKISTKDQLEEEIGQMEEIQGLMRKRDSLKEEVKKKKEEIGQKEDSLNEMIKGSYAYLLEDKLRKANQSLKEKEKAVESELQEKTMELATNKLIKKSLEKDKCQVCDREINEKIRKRFSNQTTNKDISIDEVTDQKREIGVMRNKTEIILRELREGNPVDIKQEIDDLKEKKRGIEEEIKKLTNKMGDRDEDYKSLQKEVTELESETDDLKDKIRERNKEVKKLGGEIEDKEKEIKEKEQKTDDIKVLETKKKWAKRMKKKLEKIRKVGTKKRRSDILEEMNDLFQFLTERERGYDKIQFKEGTYSPILLTKSGEMMSSNEVGDGQKQIIAFSFLLGLNRYSDRNVPLIIDAPFTVLDKVYRENLSILLGELTNQVILLVKDTSRAIGDVQKYLEENQQAEFRIERDFDNYCSTIEEEEA